MRDTTRDASRTGLAIDSSFWAPSIFMPSRPSTLSAARRSLRLAYSWLTEVRIVGPQSAAATANYIACRTWRRFPRHPAHAIRPGRDPDVGRFPPVGSPGGVRRRRPACRVSHAMGNTIATSNMLFATYNPVNMASVRKVHEARIRGRRRLRRGVEPPARRSAGRPRGERNEAKKSEQTARKSRNSGR
jgi:hypothetical protein